VVPVSSAGGGALLLLLEEQPTVNDATNANEESPATQPVDARMSSLRDADRPDLGVSAM
jgi:hypothetical protein